jgi:3',5'-cyclic AMP phosphodiesterase CpdA
MAAVAAAISLGGAASALGSTSTPIAAYSIAAPTAVAESGLVARAVVPAGAPCPNLVVDGRAFRTKARLAGPTTGAAFAPIMACERVMPVGATSAVFGGATIPAAMPARVDTLVMFGDSGCRMKQQTFQNCARVDDWPLARIARRVSATNPDVIAFTGDFFYREAACPANLQAWCGASPPPVTGMPFTDSAYGWMADVLIPMAPMLRTAPIVAVRGNHESCSRGGNGYFMLMDPRPSTADICAPVVGANGALTAATPNPTAPYAIDLPISRSRTTRLVVADSADGQDSTVTPTAALLRPRYAEAARLAAPRRGRESWLLVHRPLFGLLAPAIADGGSQWSSADQQAASKGQLGNYRMIVSSHIHVVEAVQVPGQPGQMVLGNGGTQLEAVATAIPAYGALANPNGTPIDPAYAPYPTATRLWGESRFGYAVATPGSGAGRWSVIMRDTSGRAFGTCSLSGRSLTCRDT